MQKLDILNTRERKQVLKLLNEQFGFDGKIDDVILKNSQEKLFLARKELFDLDLKKLRIDSLGLYFGQLVNGQLRLSIEGSQLIGPKAKKNVIKIDDGQRKEWMAGNELDISADKGFVIIRCDEDFLGCGKSTGNRLLNYYPKVRRIT